MTKIELLKNKTMKYIIAGILTFGFMQLSIAQDTTKTVNAGVPGQVGRQGTSFPLATLARPAVKATAETIAGKYSIDHYIVQIKKTGNKEVIGAVGTEVTVSDTLMVGDSFGTISFQISEKELMSTEDYLYRIFGEIPSEIPADIPATLYVLKTNNLECYGIGQLSDGTILIPKEGVLLYLKPIKP